MLRPENVTPDPNRLATLAFNLCETWTKVQSGNVLMDGSGTVDEVAATAAQIIKAKGLLKALLPHIPTTQHYKNALENHFFDDQLLQVDDCDNPYAAEWFLILRKGEVGIFDKRQAARLEADIIGTMAADYLGNMQVGMSRGNRLLKEKVIARLQREELLEVIAEFKDNYKDLGEEYSLPRVLEKFLAEAKEDLAELEDKKEQEDLKLRIQAISLLLRLAQVQ